MKLPHIENLVVPEDKITKYLLNVEHRTGGSKARFFLKHGYGLADWIAFANDLKHLANTHDVVSIANAPGGKNYVIDGTMISPSGHVIEVRSVWYIGDNSNIPRLASAYPG